MHELHAVSHDPTCSTWSSCATAARMTAVQLQREYLDQAHKFVEDRLGGDADDGTVDVLARWE